MALSLKLSIKQSHCILAGEIWVELSLQNQGRDTIETASLYDNNRITNYVLSNQDDKIIGTYNHITRQLLFEKTEPRTDDFRLIQLPAGGVEKREQNFCTWHTIEQPGIYHLRGLYRWQDIELTTPTVKFEVKSASVTSLDYQWSYHYGEKYLLNSVWVVENDNNTYTAYIRQSARFRPQIINYNPVLIEQPTRFTPKISLDRSLVVGGPLWISWVEGSELVYVQILEGQIQLGPVRMSLGLSHPEWIAPPLSSRSGELSLFLTGTDPSGNRAVEALEVNGKGKLQKQRILSVDVSAARNIRGVCNQEGRYYILWHSEKQVHACEIDLATLQPAQIPQIIWTTKNVLVELFTPPVLDDEGLFTCLVQYEKPQRFGVIWLQITEPGDCVKEEEPPLPPPGSIVSCTGQMNHLGHLFVLSRTGRGIYYLNTAIMQSLQIADKDSAKSIAHEQLIVTPRNDVYLGVYQEKHGLRERLIHQGTQEDLEDLGEEDEE